MLGHENIAITLDRLEKWEFYIVPTAVIDKELGNQKTFAPRPHEGHNESGRLLAPQRKGRRGARSRELSEEGLRGYGVEDLNLSTWAPKDLSEISAYMRSITNPAWRLRGDCRP